MQSDNIIFFFGPKQEHGFLSNFYIAPMEIDGVIYNCVEQFMHAEKARVMGDTRIRKEILMTESPKEQKRLGRLVKPFDTKKWDEVREDIVYSGLYEKFRQHPHLRRQLLETGDNYLAEANPWDKVWGIGELNQPKERWGKNLLGELLMDVRTEIRELQNNESRCKSK